MTRILAIEPDADRAVLLQQLVRESLNTDLVLATSTDVAIQAMTQTRPDLILTSMLLSANEEQDLVAHLRATPSLGHIPVLTIPAVTNLSTTETRSTGLFARFRRRRQQPMWPTYNFNAVVTRIEEALEQSRIAAAQAAKDAEERVIEPDQIVETSVTIAPIVESPEIETIESVLLANRTQKRARRLPVSDVPWLSSVKLAWGQRLRLLNISSSGVLVESGVRLSPGSLTKFQLDGPELALAVPARVVRCRVSEVDSLGVKYETAAVFDHPVDALVAADQEPVDAEEQLDNLVAAVTANAASGTPAAELRSTFETGVLVLITAREVRLRDVPVVENDGRESVYFTVPTLDGSRAVLQVTFNANDAPGLEDFDVLTAAAQAAARVLPVTGITKRVAVQPHVPAPTPALRVVGGRQTLELQIA